LLYQKVQFEGGERLYLKDLKGLLLLKKEKKKKRKEKKNC